MIFKNGGKVFYISPNKELYTEISQSKHVSESSLSKEVLDKCIHFINNFDEEAIHIIEAVLLQEAEFQQLVKTRK